MADGMMTVTELTANIKKHLEQEFTSVVVMGEVSRLTKPASGHLYFTIKDSHAAISAVIWRSALQRMRLQPSEHQAFVFSGYLSLYEPRGAYQLVVTRIEAVGAGQLAVEFEKRKALFADRGWFDKAIKKEIPALPKHIGIVTSASTAAFEDVKKVLRARPAWLRLTLSPAIVQGDSAADSIASALHAFEQMQDKPDVVLLVRGGGSVEDLWCFNDEQVIRAIVESSIPIISGVGHEIDMTLTDFAADVRAATPSNAAELCCPSKKELRQNLPNQQALLHGLRQKIIYYRRQQQQASERLHFASRRKLDAYHYRVSQSQHVIQQQSLAALSLCRRRNKVVVEHLLAQEPGVCLRQQRQRCSAACQQLQILMGSKVHLSVRHQQQAQARLSAIISLLMQRLKNRKQLLDNKLQALGPRQVLSRGYTLAYSPSGALLTSIDALPVGQTFTLQFHDGYVSSKVLQQYKDK